MKTAIELAIEASFSGSVAKMWAIQFQTLLALHRAQVIAELARVEVEPIYFEFEGDLFKGDIYPNSLIPDSQPLYTVEQLAAARVQTAAQEREICAHQIDAASKNCGDAAYKFGMALASKAIRARNTPTTPTQEPM